MSDPTPQDTFHRLMDLPAEGWRLVHPGRNRTKADVHRVTADGAEYAVKDFRGRSSPVRLTLGRWSLEREERAYRALAGVPGIPAFAGRPHPLVLVTSWVDGTSLAAWDRERPLPDGLFPRLKELVGEVHRRGVVQGDLHHRDVLVGRDGEVWLVDFSTAMTGGTSGGPLRGRLWHALAAHDRRAVLKLQERFQPGSLNGSEHAELAERPALERLVRRVRRLVRGS